VRMIMVRVLAVLFALTWLIFPGFGLIDLSVTWDPEWPVVLEASWGVFMSVLVGGSFLAVAVRPHRAAAATVTLFVALSAMLLSAAVGLEWPLLGYAGLLVLQGAGLAALIRRLPDREPVRRRGWSVRLPLFVVAALGIVPWLLHADRMFGLNRRSAGEVIGDLTNGVDHYAVQGALALALVTLALLAACWPRGRRFTGISVGLCAAYVGVVSLAFPREFAGLSPSWSVLCIGWALAVAALAVPSARLQPGQLRFEVVEAERAL
jgi:hypothetical protein